MKYKKYRFPTGFTLVELIVVITILAILGTVGFISLQGYSSKARDSARVSDITNITKGLEILLTKGSTLPQPENVVTITASGVTLRYQGYAGKNVLSAIGMSTTMDPLDTKYYTYSTNSNQNIYQVFWLFEESKDISLVSPIPEVYANSYSERYARSKWSNLGILIGTGSNLNQPVQELSLTGVDILNTTDNYTIFFDKNTQITGTGLVLKAGIVSTQGMVGYWDMETMSSWKLVDMSGNGNEGTLTGSSVPTLIAWKVGKALNFNGNGYISLWNKEGFKIKDDITISVLIKTNTTTGFWNLSIIGKYGSANPGDLWYNINLNQNGVIACWWLWCPGFWWKPYASVADNVYHNIVTSTAGDISTLYLDGMKIKTTDVLNKFDVSNLSTTELRIGSVVRGWTNFSWSIDEVRLYNRALSYSEIQTLYNSMK